MTGPDLRIERKRRGLTLSDVGRHMKPEPISGERVRQIETQTAPTEAWVNRLVTAIMDADFAQPRKLLERRSDLAEANS